MSKRDNVILQKIIDEASTLEKMLYGLNETAF